MGEEGSGRDRRVKDWIVERGRMVRGGEGVGGQVGVRVRMLRGEAAQA